MKTKFTLLKLLITLCVTFATTATFGQTVYTWTNNNVADMGVAANWSPNAVPFIGSGSVAGDTMLFNGTSTGAVKAFSNTGSQVGSSVGNALAGIYVHLTGGQVNPVTFYTTVANAASSGIRFNSLIFDSGAGAFTMGTGSTTNCLDTLWGTSNPSQQGFTNNSANPVVINLDVRWRYGAGGAHTIVFGGTGDYYITNDIANVNTSATLIFKDGPGTMYWTAGHNAFWGTITTISTPMTIAGGTLVLKSSSLFPATTTINMTAASAPSLLKFDVVGGSQTIANPVTGAGSVQVNNGTLTLSGANTFTGGVVLSGGALVANRAENLGVNGPLGNLGSISFTGGTLTFSSLNTYDYSPRITNSASQSFKFDTAGQNVTFTNGLASSSGTLTKLGSGTLTLSGANTYDGATTISAGKLLIQGSQGSGAITVANSTALGVTETGPQITPASLTVGTSSGAALEFNNVSSTGTAAIAVAGAVSAGGTITVNVASGAFLIGQHYPLFSWGSGTPPPVTLGTLTGAGGNLSTNGNTIQLNITSLAFVWTGLNPLNANFWDTVTTNNWKVNGVSQIFANGGTALFDDTVTSGQTNIVLNTAVSPASVTVNSSTKVYSIASSGTSIIDGTGGLTKNGNSTLTLSGGVNNYNGVTTISGGTLSVGVLANGGSVRDIGSAGSAAGSLVLNGGTLQLNATVGGATSDHLFTLGTAGGTVDDESGSGLTLNNSGSIVMNGTGARTLTLRGNGNDELDASLTDNGGATALTKSGAGTWIVNANNPISGAVTITGGILQVGTGGATGSVGSGNIAISPAASALNYNTTATVTNGTVSGTGSVTVSGGGTVVMPGNNSYSGGTTIANGSTLQVGIGGATGQLAANAVIDVEGTLIFNTASLFSYGGNGITGGGNVVVTGGGQMTDVGANSYTGWTLIDPGSTFQPCQGNTGGLASSVVTNNGTLLLIRQDNGIFIYSAGPVVGSGRVVVDCNNVNAGDVTLEGACTYTGGTFIGDNGLVVGDGGVNGSIIGNVTFQNSTTSINDNTRTLTFNRSDDITFTGNIVTNFASTQANRGRVVQLGAGTLTLTGTNTYASGTVISAGTVQVGNGGTSGTLGSGAITDNGNLTYNRSDSVTVGSVISGVGSLVQEGAGILTLTANNTYNGINTISNGTLVINGANAAASTYVAGGKLGGTGTLAGPVTMDPGTTLAPGASVGTLTINSDLSFGGNLAIEVNKTLTPSNDLVVVSGALTNTGTGTLTVSNLGPALTSGDTFTLFSQPLLNGAALTVTGGGAGVTWTNNLAVDGSITVLSSGSTPPPVAGFSGTPTNGFAPLSVTFTDASTGSITNWVWVFGDGSSVTNTSNANQGHTYAVAGTNTVSLIVNGPGGSSTNTRAGYIAVVSAKVVFGGSVNPGSFGSGKLGFSGTGGPAGVQYRVLTQTNITQPLANWTPIYTNTFNSDGSYGYTNSTLVGNQGYLILVSP